MVSSRHKMEQWSKRKAPLKTWREKDEELGGGRKGVEGAAPSHRPGCSRAG